MPFERSCSSGLILLSGIISSLSANMKYMCNGDQLIYILCSNSIYYHYYKGLPYSLRSWYLDKYKTAKDAVCFLIISMANSTMMYNFILVRQLKVHSHRQHININSIYYYYSSIEIQVSFITLKGYISITI